MQEISESNHSLLTAIQFATAAHRGQKYGVGTGAVDYIVHPLMVASLVETQVAKKVAILHDVLEDTETTYLELLSKFGWKVAWTVLNLTRNSSADYEAYIEIVSNDRLSTTVKIADLTVNLWFARNNFFGKENEYLPLVPRYEKALEYLRSVTKEKGW